MAGDIATAFVRIRPNVSSFKSETESQVGDAFSGIGKKLTEALGLAFAAKTGFDFTKSIVTGAADLQKQVEVIKEEFGAASDAVLKFGETGATAFGISARLADQTSAKFGVLFHGLQIGQNQAAAMTLGFEALAGSIATIRNIAPDQLLQQIPLAAAGNTRALRALGVSLDQTEIKQEALTLGLIKAGEPLTRSAAAVAIYNLATKNLPTYLSQAAAHSGDLADKMAFLNAEWSNAKDKLGAQLLPVFTHFATVAGNDLPRAMAVFTTAMRDTFGFLKAVTAPIGGVINGIKGLAAAFAAFKTFGFVKGVFDVLVEAGRKATATATDGAKAQIAANNSVIGSLSKVSAAHGEVQAKAVTSAVATRDAHLSASTAISETAAKNASSINAVTDTAVGSVAKLGSTVEATAAQVATAGQTMTTGLTGVGGALTSAVGEIGAASGEATTALHGIGDAAEASAARVSAASSQIVQSLSTVAPAGGTAGTGLATALDAPQAALTGLTDKAAQMGAIVDEASAKAVSGLNTLGGAATTTGVKFSTTADQILLGLGQVSTASNASSAQAAAAASAALDPVAALAAGAAEGATVITGAAGETNAAFASIAETVAGTEAALARMVAAIQDAGAAVTTSFGEISAASSGAVEGLTSISATATTAGAAIETASAGAAASLAQIGAAASRMAEEVAAAVAANRAEILTLGAASSQAAAQVAASVRPVGASIESLSGSAGMTTAGVAAANAETAASFAQIGVAAQVAAREVQAAMAEMAASIAGVGSVGDQIGASISAGVGVADEQFATLGPALTASLAVVGPAADAAVAALDGIAAAAATMATAVESAGAAAATGLVPLIRSAEVAQATLAQIAPEAGVANLIGGLGTRTAVVDTAVKQVTRDVSALAPAAEGASVAVTDGMAVAETATSSFGLAAAGLGTIFTGLLGPIGLTVGLIALLNYKSLSGFFSGILSGGQASQNTLKGLNTDLATASKTLTALPQAKLQVLIDKQSIKTDTAAINDAAKGTLGYQVALQNLHAQQATQLQDELNYTRLVSAHGAALVSIRQKILGYLSDVKKERSTSGLRAYELNLNNMSRTAAGSGNRQIALQIQQVEQLTEKLGKMPTNKEIGVKLHLDAIGVDKFLQEIAHPDFRSYTLALGQIVQNLGFLGKTHLARQIAEVHALADSLGRVPTVKQIQVALNLDKASAARLQQEIGDQLQAAGVTAPAQSAKILAEANTSAFQDWDTKLSQVAAHLASTGKASDFLFAHNILLVESLNKALGRAATPHEIKLIMRNEDITTQLKDLMGQLPAADRDAILQAGQVIGATLAEGIASTDPLSAMISAAVNSVSAAIAGAKAAADAAKAAGKTLDAVREKQKASLDALSNSIAEMQTQIGVDISQRERDIVDAVNSAKTNLQSIVGSLGQELSQMLDAPLAALSNKLSLSDAKIGAANAKLTLENLRRSALLPGGRELSKDPTKALAELEAAYKHAGSSSKPAIEAFILQYQTAANAVQQSSITVQSAANTIKKTKIDISLGNLASEFNRGLISVKTFRERLLVELKKAGVPMKEVAKLLGQSFIDQFHGNVQGALLQAQASAEGPKRPGAGFVPSIVRPLLTEQQDTRNIIKEQKALQVKSNTYQARIAGYTQTLANAVKRAEKAGYKPTARERNPVGLTGANKVVGGHLTGR